MNWFESLPDSCPPKDAKYSSGVAYYRLINSIPITDNDFISARRLKPNKKFKVNECQAMALSIFPSAEGCRNILKFPKFKGKQNYIGEVILEENDGVIANTPSKIDKNHISWWRSDKFDISKVKIVEYEN